jgi:hypothetical protein
MKRILVLGLVLIAGPALAADQAAATAALAGAEQTEAQAGKLLNRWLPTEAALKAARAAMAKQDWDTALAQATLAHALAERSVEQATEQKTVWQDAVIK